MASEWQRTLQDVRARMTRIQDKAPRLSMAVLHRNYLSVLASVQALLQRASDLDQHFAQHCVAIQRVMRGTAEAAAMQDDFENVGWDILALAMEVEHDMAVLVPLAAATASSASSVSRALAVADGKLQRVVRLIKDGREVISPMTYAALVERLNAAIVSRNKAMLLLMQHGGGKPLARQTDGIIIQLAPSTLSPPLLPRDDHGRPPRVAAAAEAATVSYVYYVTCDACGCIASGVGGLHEDVFAIPRCPQCGSVELREYRATHEEQMSRDWRAAVVEIHVGGSDEGPAVTYSVGRGTPARMIGQCMHACAIM